MPVNTAAVGASLSFDIDASSIETVTAKLGALVDAAEATEAQVGAISGAFESFQRILRQTATAVAGVELFTFVREAITAAARTNELGFGLLAVAKNARISAAALDQSEAALRKSGISAQESRNQILRLVQAHIDLAKAPALAAVAANTGIVSGRNTSDTFSRVNYAITSGQSEILRDMGLQVNFEAGYARFAQTLGTTANSLNEVQKVQARTNEVIRTGADFTGLYDAAMETAGKQMRSTVRYAEDMKAAVGEAYQPLYTRAVFAYANSLKFLGQNAEYVNVVINTAASVVGVLLVAKLADAIRSVTVFREAWLTMRAAVTLSEGVAGVLALINPMTALVATIALVTAAFSLYESRSSATRKYEQEHKLAIEETNAALAKKIRLMNGVPDIGDLKDPKQREIAAGDEVKRQRAAFNTDNGIIDGTSLPVQLNYLAALRRGPDGTAGGGLARIKQTRDDYMALQDMVKSGQITVEEATATAARYVAIHRGAWDQQVLNAWVLGSQALNNAEKAAEAAAREVGKLKGEIEAAADVAQRFALHGLSAPETKKTLETFNSAKDAELLARLPGNQRDRDRLRAAAAARPMTPEEEGLGLTPLQALMRARGMSYKQQTVDNTVRDSVENSPYAKDNKLSPEQILAERRKLLIPGVTKALGMKPVTGGAPDVAEAANVAVAAARRQEVAEYSLKWREAADAQVLEFGRRRILMDAELAGTKRQTAAVRASADAQRILSDAEKVRQATLGLDKHLPTAYREEFARRMAAQQAAERAREFAQQQRQEEIGNNVLAQGNDFLRAKVTLLGSTTQAQDALNRQEAIAKFIAQEGENASRFEGQRKIALLTEQYDLQLKLSRAEQEAARRADILAQPWIEAFRSIQQAGKGMFTGLFTDGVTGLQSFMKQVKGTIVSILADLASASVTSRITATLTRPGGPFGRDGLASRLKAQLGGAPGRDATTAPEIAPTPEAIATGIAAPAAEVVRLAAPVITGIRTAPADPRPVLPAPLAAAVRATEKGTAGPTPNVAAVETNTQALAALTRATAGLTSAMSVKASVAVAARPTSGTEAIAEQARARTPTVVVETKPIERSVPTSSPFTLPPESTPPRTPAITIRTRQAAAVVPPPVLLPGSPAVIVPPVPTPTVSVQPAAVSAFVVQARQAAAQGQAAAVSRETPRAVPPVVQVLTQQAARTPTPPGISGRADPPRPLAIRVTTAVPQVPTSAAGDGFGERGQTDKTADAMEGLTRTMDGVRSQSEQLAKVTTIATATQDKTETRLGQLNKLFAAASGGVAVGLLAGQYQRDATTGGLLGGLGGGIQGGLAAGPMGAVVGGLTGLISGIFSGDAAKHAAEVAGKLFSAQFGAALADFTDAAKGISSSLKSFNLKADLQAKELQTSLDTSEFGKAARALQRLRNNSPGGRAIIEAYEAFTKQIAEDVVALKALEATNRRKAFTDEVRNLASPEGSNVTKVLDIFTQRTKDEASLAELGLDPAIALTLQGERLAAMLKGISGGGFAALIAALPQLSGALYDAKQQADALYQAELKQQDIGTYANVGGYDTVRQIFDLGRPGTPGNPYTGYQPGPNPDPGFGAPRPFDPGLGYTVPSGIPGVVSTPGVTAIPTVAQNPGAAANVAQAPTINRTTIMITIGPGAIVTPVKSGEELFEQVVQAGTKIAARQLGNPQRWSELSPTKLGL